VNKPHSYNVRKIVMVILIPVIALLSYATYITRRAEARDRLQTEISHLIVQYRNGETQSIDLSKVSLISWDRLYIFGPYVQLKSIQNSLGYSWRPDTFFFPGPERAFNYLFFTRNGKVIQYVEYPLDWGNFAEKDRKVEGYIPSEAHFIINTYGYIFWSEE